MTPRQFLVTAATAEQPPAVTATGDIDMANVDEFREALAQAAANSPTITVDLTQVSYCDSAALRALFATANSTQLMLLVSAAGTITTLLRISGLDQVSTVTVTD